MVDEMFGYSFDNKSRRLDHNHWWELGVFLHWLKWYSGAVETKRPNTSEDSEECSICWFLLLLTWATSDQQTENPYLKAAKWLLNGICLSQKSQGQMFVLCWMGCQTNDQNRSFWPQTFLSIQILHFSSKTGWMDVYILWETAKPAG